MRPNELQDVWKFVTKLGNASCWPWKGYISSSGYGKFRYAGKYLPAHRAVYFAVHGKVANNIPIMHLCNNKVCCNPEHLVAGTNSLNQLHYQLSVSPKSSTGIKGVCYNSKRKQYQVTVDQGKSFLYRGPDLETAIAVRNEYDRKKVNQLVNLGVEVNEHV